MEVRKVQSKGRYILAFLIATFVFINVFFFTYLVSYFEYQRISNQQEQLSYSIFEDKLYSSLFDTTNCSSLDKVSEDLRFQGSIINLLEKRLGKNDEGVLFRKKYYSLIELEHFEFVKEMNYKCNLSIPTIMFFYSNEEEDVKAGDNFGKLLDSVYARNNNLFIYSFDVNLNDRLIEGLKKEYKIEVPLTIIIDGKTKLVNPRNIDEIEGYL